MDDDKLFVIAIGGTGMRCLESFVHLCAAGMFDNKEIDILTLDTDQGNGNKSRVEGLIGLYNKIKTNDSANPGGSPNANTFFSAKLNLYTFATEYGNSERKNFRTLSRLNSGSAEQKQDNDDLADLFLDKETVQNFNLDHGYRAQTHLGSMLMYHGILEAAREIKSGKNSQNKFAQNLSSFIDLIHKNSSRARVFIFGSVFGGTGASSIPVVPIALRDAMTILSGGGGATFNLNQIKFGSTLLTDYFSFANPSDSQINREGVIANSKNFALNSQAALQFYLGDPTVKACYKRLYHIGWPSQEKTEFKNSDANTETITGGDKQKNPAHVVELMCAAAAYDFFTAPINEQQATYLYRCAELDDNGRLRLTGRSFMDDGEKFENKFGALLSFAHISLSKHLGAFGMSGTEGFLERFNKQGIFDYDSITAEQSKEIDDYLKLFAYNFVGEKLKKGWIYQINDTVPGSFVFSPDAFRTDVRELRKIDPGKVFNDDAHNWRAGKFGIGNSYDQFIKGLTKTGYSDDQNVSTVKEQFLGHLYNAITEAQGFNY